MAEPRPDGEPQPARSSNPAPQQRAVNVFDLLQIGAVCGVTIGLGVFIGYLVDSAAGTAPLLTFVGLALGILGAATGSWHVIRPFTAASREATTPKE